MFILSRITRSILVKPMRNWFWSNRTADIAKAGEKAIGTLEMGRLICDRI